MRVRIFFAIAVLAVAVGAWEPVGPYLNKGRPVAGAVSQTQPGRAGMVVMRESLSVLYLSDDAGANWTVVNEHLPFRPTRLAFDPRQESTVVALGQDAWLSLDLGARWERMALPTVGTWRGIEFPGNDTGRLNLVGTQMTTTGSRAVLACSTVSGWEVIVCDTTVPSYAASVFTDPADSLHMIVGGYAGGPCVYISTDGGANWQRSPLPVGVCQEQPREEPPGGGVHTVQVFEFPEDAVLAVTRWQGMYRSTDAGANWRSVGTLENLTLARMWGAPGHAVVSIGRAVRRTTDAGASWGRDWTIPGSSNVCFLAAVPGSVDVALCATDKGVYRSGNGGWIWALRGVPGVGTVTALGRWSDLDAPLYVLLDDHRLARACAAGEGWVECAVPIAERVADVAAGPGGKVWLLSAGETGPACLFRSDDSGTSWVQSDSWLATGGAVAVESPGTVLAVGSRPDTDAVGRLAFVLSTDGGQNWQRGLCDPGQGQVAAIAAEAPGWMLMAGGSGDSALVLVSDDTGRTWTRRDLGVSGAVRTALWHRYGGTAWCGTDQGVFLSDDGGLSWSYGGLAAVRGLSRNDRLLLAATRTGYYVSDDGRNWFGWNDGLPTLDVTAVAPEYSRHGRYGFCGTNGAGVFRIWFTGVVESPDDRPRLTSSPPVFCRGRFSHSGAGSAILLDAAGRRVARLGPGTRETDVLAPGLYFLRPLDGSTVRRVVVVR